MMQHRHLQKLTYAMNRLLHKLRVAHLVSKFSAFFWHSKFRYHAHITLKQLHPVNILTLFILFILYLCQR
jgi:hypothetical protein